MERRMEHADAITVLLEMEWNANVSVKGFIILT